MFATVLAQYDEMRNVNLPKDTTSYEKKAEEVEHLQLQAQAVEDQRILLSTKTTDRDTMSGHHGRYPSSPDFDPAATSPPSTFSSGGGGSSLMRRKSSRRHSRRHSNASSKSLALPQGAPIAQTTDQRLARLPPQRPHCQQALPPCPRLRQAPVTKRQSPTSSTSSSRAKVGTQLVRRLRRSLVRSSAGCEMEPDRCRRVRWSWLWRRRTIAFHERNSPWHLQRQQSQSVQSHSDTRDQAGSC